MNTCRIGRFALVLALLSPAALAGGLKPGSVLIYPINASSTQGSLTILSVTNSHLVPATGSTLVEFQYVDAAPTADPFRPNCTVFNTIEFLTPADTFPVVTVCHNPTPTTQGYVVVSAQNPQNLDDWSHNFLLGQQLVLTPGNGMYGLNPISYTSPLPEHDSTDLDADGQLDFNNVEYEAVPDQHMVANAIVLNNPQLTLINLTGKLSDVNTVAFSIWNDNELAFSAQRSFSCWVDLPLSFYSGIFDEVFLDATPNDLTELDLNCNGVGGAETVWFRIDSVNVSTPAGMHVASDGAIVGAMTDGPITFFDAGYRLWESTGVQTNGDFSDD